MPTMLVIEDDQGIRELMAMLFDDEGYTVESASSIAEGNAKLRSLRPNVVLLDLHFADGSGASIVSACHSDEHLRRIPIIVITGSRYEPEPRYENIAAIFEKPFDVDQLCQTVTMLVSDPTESVPA